MEQIEQIKNHPVYQEVIRDSLGGIMYNVANQDKYDTTEIVEMWDNLTPALQEASGGIMKGAFNFMKGV